MTILEALKHGQHRAQTKLQLAQALDWYTVTDKGPQPDTRRVEKEIERLRREGKAGICSSGSGYWLPESLAEMKNNIQSRRRRAIKQLTTTRGERNWLRRQERPVFWVEAA